MMGDRTVGGYLIPGNWMGDETIGTKRPTPEHQCNPPQAMAFARAGR